MNIIQDWRNNNQISAYHSSNAEASTFWLKITNRYDVDKEATAQLTTKGGRLLIALIEKIIEDMESEEQ